MSVKYAAFLGVIVLNATNNSLVWRENATDHTVTIPVGRYFLRGDGTASCILTAIKTAVELSFGGNTYTIAVAWSIDAAAVHAVVTITRATGAVTFQVKFASATTTFDSLLLGFARADSTNSAAAKVSTLSPTSAWVPNDVPVFYEPGYEAPAASSKRARSGRVRGLMVGDELHVRDVRLQFIDSRRVLHWDNTADQAATFAAFLRRARGGLSFELHLSTVSGVVLAALSIASTRLGAEWYFDQNIVQVFKPERMQLGLAMYAWDMTIWGSGGDADGSSYWDALPDLTGVLIVPTTSYVSYFHNGSAYSPIYSLIGTLPTGLSFDAATCTISGTADGAYDVNVTIRATVGSNSYDANLHIIITDTI